MINQLRMREQQQNFVLQTALGEQVPVLGDETHIVMTLMMEGLKKKFQYSYHRFQMSSFFSKTK